MLKQLVLLFAIVAATQALPGGWSEQTAITDDVMDLARWTTSQLSSYTNGVDHTIMTVRNVKTQVVAGKNYMFTIDVVVTSADQKYEIQSCDVSIFDQPWTQTRYFIQPPVCKSL